MPYGALTDAISRAGKASIASRPSTFRTATGHLSSAHAFPAFLKSWPGSAPPGQNRPSRHLFHFPPTHPIFQNIHDIRQPLTRKCNAFDEYRATFQNNLSNRHEYLSLIPVVPPHIHISANVSLHDTVKLATFAMLTI